MQRSRGCSRRSTIGGREYVDGGVWSPTNLDAAPAGRDTHVLCLNPTASITGSRDACSASIRSVARSAVSIEALALRRRGAAVQTVAPNLECAAAMGTNFMDREPRGRVLAAGYRQGLALAERRREPRPPLKPRPDRALAAVRRLHVAASASAATRLAAERVRQRPHVRAAGRLEDVGRDALAGAGDAADLEHDRGLAERVLAAGDGVDAELAQPRVDAGGGVDRAEDRVDRAVAGERAGRAPRPRASRTPTVACGGRREEASTSNHSSW